jgi:hypothetical protein
MKLLIIQFPPSSCHFMLLNTFSLEIYFKIPPVYVPLSVRDPVLHPYITTGKSMVFVYSNFHFFRQQTRRQKFLGWIDTIDTF